MKADRRTKLYAVAAIGLEVVGLVIALVNNLTRWFSDPLTDLSRMVGAAGLVLVGAPLESIRRLNER